MYTKRALISILFMKPEGNLSQFHTYVPCYTEVSFSLIATLERDVSHEESDLKVLYRLVSFALIKEVNLILFFSRE